MQKTDKICKIFAYKSEFHKICKKHQILAKNGLFISNLPIIFYDAKVKMRIQNTSVFLRSTKDNKKVSIFLYFLLDIYSERV